jgi:hypothetical protein
MEKYQEEKLFLIILSPSTDKTRVRRCEKNDLVELKFRI